MILAQRQSNNNNNNNNKNSIKVSLLKETGSSWNLNLIELVAMWNHIRASKAREREDDEEPEAVDTNTF